MKKQILLILLLLLGFVQVWSQDIWITRTGNVMFHAGTALEDIDGTSTEAASLLNVKTGDLAFQIPVKSFHFKRSLMEEHFNENYMESNKFPKSTFSGKINDISKVNFTKDGVYPVIVEGDLTIHGFTRKMTTPASITIVGGKINATAHFTVLIADYNIPIPGVVSEKIAKEASIEVKCSYDKKN
ncbi:MAG TPA: YceI family protein [Chitinophagaceae bacterium]|nr:YceI family protein [Chitinophagaceae bacterium]